MIVIAKFDYFLSIFQNVPKARVSTKLQTVSLPAQDEFANKHLNGGWRLFAQIQATIN